MKTLTNINFFYIIGLLTLSLTLITGCYHDSDYGQSDINIKIKGTVVDSEDLSPIPSAKVSFIKLLWSSDKILKTVKTNEKGEYRIEQFWGGYCGNSLLQVKVEKEGYQTTRAPWQSFNCAEYVQVCDFELAKIGPR